MEQHIADMQALLQDMTDAAAAKAAANAQHTQTLLEKDTQITALANQLQAANEQLAKLPDLISQMRAQFQALKS